MFTSNFIEVYMQTTVAACEQRDNKGHYAKARSGEYQNFPGIDVEYEAPVNPEIKITVDAMTIEDSSKQILDYLKKHFINRH